jgi:hypothetical protein
VRYVRGLPGEDREMAVTARPRISEVAWRQVTEVAVTVGVLNRMLELGRPEYVRIV